MGNKLKEKLDREVRRERISIVSIILFCLVFILFLSPSFSKKQEITQGFIVRLSAIQTATGSKSRLIIELKNGASVFAIMPPGFLVEEGKMVNVKMKKRFMGLIRNYWVIGYVQDESINTNSDNLHIVK